MQFWVIGTLVTAFVIAGSNPNNDSPCLEVEFDRFGQPVSFPMDSQIEEYAACITMEQVSIGSRPFSVAASTTLW